MAMKKPLQIFSLKEDEDALPRALRLAKPMI
jgi:hypothetical protein